MRIGSGLKKETFRGTRYGKGGGKISFKALGGSSKISVKGLHLKTPPKIKLTNPLSIKPKV